MMHTRKNVYSLVYLFGEARLKKLWAWDTEKDD